MSMILPVTNRAHANGTYLTDPFLLFADRLTICKSGTSPTWVVEIIPQNSRRYDFTLIVLRRPGSEYISSINYTVERTMLFFDINSAPCRYGRRYLAALNDYRRRSVALPL
ncbi:hypothetical protein EVAR_90720_1 [Eumeta japonica]|uniref:Uncharacterized protein n=1 Tax=Eumeta variegata TaxID=151549 RepID=A0A4C1ZFT7_EUMVA|nr:hypothetical protein EVAR_90720_1 [Eumeta japonica]